MSTSTATSVGRLATAFLAELDNEAKVTRSCLERVPVEKFDWKPHEKSMTMGRLAVHCAEMFGWTKETLKSDVLDFATMDYIPFEPKSTEELLAFFDDHITDSHLAFIKVNLDRRRADHAWDSKLPRDNRRM